MEINVISQSDIFSVLLWAEKNIHKTKKSLLPAHFTESTIYRIYIIICSESQKHKIPKIINIEAYFFPRLSISEVSFFHRKIYLFFNINRRTKYEFIRKKEIRKEIIYPDTWMCLLFDENKKQMLNLYTPSLSYI